MCMVSLCISSLGRYLSQPQRLCHHIQVDSEHKPHRPQSANCALPQLDSTLATKRTESQRRPDAGKAHLGQAHTHTPTDTRKHRLAHRLSYLLCKSSAALARSWLCFIILLWVKLVNDAWQHQKQRHENWYAKRKEGRGDYGWPRVRTHAYANGFRLL